jgi:DNA-binding XRE family transcriptional regulator
MQGIDAKAIGQRLRELRGAKTQAEVAEAVGVTTMAISQYETGERIPKDDIKLALALYFNSNVNDIFFTL